MVDDFEFIEYINSLGYEYREKGDEIQFRECPYCGKKDWKFSFNRSSQVFHCFHENSCGARGNLYRFKSDRGHLEPVVHAMQKQYKRPKEDKSILSNVDEFYKWYEKERWIKTETLKKYGVGLDKHGGNKYIVYSYRSENGELINKKHRGCNDKKKQWMEKDAELSFYGAQFLDFEKKELHIVEGEDDCHAAAMIGIDNVVSVPIGAGNYSPAMDRVCQCFETIILLCDNDKAGQDGAYKIAEKIGLHKCKNVLLPFKDMRECIKNDLDIFDIQKEIQNAKRFKNDTIIKAGSLRDKIKYKLLNIGETKGTQLNGQENFNKLIGGVRTKEMTVCTGHTGRGKSTFAHNLAMWCIMSDLPTLICTFENTVEQVVTKLISIVTGEQVQGYDKLMDKWVVYKDEKWIDDKISILDTSPLYFLNKTKDNKGYFDLKKLISAMDYAVKFFNVKMIIIDHLHYFLRLTEARSPVAHIDETVRELNEYAQYNDAHVFLIVHPSKTEDSKTGELVKLGLNAGKGASSISQEAHNFIIVERRDLKDVPASMSRVSIIKQRESGVHGYIDYDVMLNKCTYRESKDQSCNMLK